MQVFTRTPLDLANVKIPRGQVFIIVERCKGCKLCVEFCPAGVLKVSAEMNAMGYHFPEIAPGKEAACIDCEFCTLVCPDFAIFANSLD